jgi:hypothetical protein
LLPMRTPYDWETTKHTRSTKGYTKKNLALECHCEERSDAAISSPYRLQPEAYSLPPIPACYFSLITCPLYSARLEDLRGEDPRAGFPRHTAGC